VIEMFAPTSRYFALESATVTLPDGRTAMYKRRRFAPPAASAALLAEVVVTQDDRIDLITARTLGDPEQFWRVCDANDALDPADLVVPGRTLRVPLPSS
jgi:nucleoid-associated protein YgaU